MAVEQETTSSDKFKELADGQKHRFLFTEKSIIVIQRKSLIVSAKSHSTLMNEYGFTLGSTFGGYLKIENGIPVLLDETSTSAAKPSQEQFADALQREILIVD